MKITKAQKEAVISLLKEKFNEKEQVRFEEFKKSVEKSVKSEFKEVIAVYKDVVDARNKYFDLCDKFDKLRKKYEEMNNYTYQGKSVPDYYKTESNLIDSIIKQRLPKVKLDICNIERQLELDTLSKDFDLNTFIQKYLGE